MKSPLSSKDGDQMRKLNWKCTSESITKSGQHQI